MSIPADLSKYTHTHDLVAPNYALGITGAVGAHTHSFSLEPQHLFLVEFLFEDDEDYAELVAIGVFSNEDIARSVAFDYSEKNIEDEMMSALFITKFTVNEVQTEDIIVAYNFKEEEQF